MTTSVGTVLDDPEMFGRGFRLQFAGLVLAVVSATAFAALVKTAGLVPPGLDPATVPEVQERTAPDFLALAVAQGAGVAGAHSLRSGVSASLVGVMIAVALVPPTAVIGIGIAWGLPTMVVGATVLVAVNALSINLAALVTLWYSGYRPERWFRLDEARSATLTRVVALVVAILVLSTVLGGVTLVSYRQAVTTDAIDEGVAAAVDASGYEGLEAIDVAVRFDSYEDRLGRPFSPSVREVVVTVGRPDDRPYPDLVERIADRVAAHAPGATVEVRYVGIDRATAGSVGVDSTPAPAAIPSPASPLATATGVVGPGAPDVPGPDW
jgi:uncharacterized hydrophobic protein (TIGR00271 family)